MRLMIIMLLIFALMTAGHTTLMQSVEENACEGLPTVVTGRLQQRTLTYDGVEREYLLYLPENYSAAQPLPLVLSFHGFGSNPRQQAGYAGWHELAQELAEAGEASLIAVYPRGSGFPARWNSGIAFGNEFGADDVGFITTLIDTLSESLCIDQSRVYANGLSNGGGMSYRLACELADRITAIGGVAGAYSALLNGCEPSRPVPVIAFHGTEDPIVPYAGGVSGPLDAPYLPDWAAEWAGRNGCDMALVELAPQGEVDGIQYTGCKGEADVILYTVNGGGHTWPGDEPGLINLVSGPTTQDIDATRVMWDFFSRFRLEGGR